MHKQHAHEGLAAVSVSLDPPADMKKVIDFLQKQDAKFTNLILDETEASWQKKLQIEGPPLIIVYDRDGKEVKRFVEYDEVDMLVVELLRKK